MNILEELIYPVIDELAPALSDPRSLKKSPDTTLWGAGSVLDSLALVTLIVSVEGRIAAKTGRSITLANEKALSRKQSPFRTLGTLSAYIAECLQDAPSREGANA